MADNLNRVSRLAKDEEAWRRFSQRCISPDDGKYAAKSGELAPYLSAGAEWLACLTVQRYLLETRIEFGQASHNNLDEFMDAIGKADPLNISLIEDEVTRHDQLAVLEELGRYVSDDTKALLHPGTTSFDILDTARAWLFKKAWDEKIRPEVAGAIEQLCSISEKSSHILQVGRTHLQDTSPVPLASCFAGYAARLADRVSRTDSYFDDLRGKISGIVGTGASIDAVIGPGKSMAFEIEVLKKLGLKPDYTATQITQKERLCDVGHGLATLMGVLGDFSNDIRMLYSSAIGEVTSRDNAQRLGGSSADATKNNPINYENICGKAVVVESGMRILYDMVHSDFQRDLRGSVEARYQPQGMMAQVYESFSRLNKSLKQLSINESRITENLRPIRDNPSEAMVAILRGEGWTHKEYGVGHDFVKKAGIKAKKEGKKLLDAAMEDGEFREVYSSLSKEKKRILNGELELYVGSAPDRARLNIDYARHIIKK